MESKYGYRKHGGIKNVKSYEASGVPLLTINTENRMKSERRLSVLCLYKKPVQSLAHDLHFLEEETKPLDVTILLQHLSSLVVEGVGHPGSSRRC